MPHNGDMICVPCRKRHHEECPGGTWCDCQHQPPEGILGPNRHSAGSAGLGRNKGRRGHVATRMAPDVTLGTVHIPDAAWTAGSVTCDCGVMSVTDPLLVGRRHVDLLRVRSAICLLAR